MHGLFRTSDDVFLPSILCEYLLGPWLLFRTIHLRVCFYYSPTFPTHWRGCIKKNCFSSFLQLMNPTLLPALGAMSPSSLLSSVPLTPHQPSAPRTSQLPQSSYGSELILSPAEAPVPQKIVDKIRSGKFVEMRELLADNMSLLEQLHSFHAPGNMSVAGPSRPSMRDVLALPSWLYCFLTYTAILTTDPTTKDKLAYTRLMILEASRHRHLGWLDYDRSFRQQAAANPSLPWNTLSPVLHATAILGNPTGKPIASSAHFAAGLITPGMIVPWRTFIRNLTHLHQRIRIPRQGCATRGIKVPAFIPVHARITIFLIHAPAHHLILLATAQKHQMTRCSSTEEHPASFPKRRITLTSCYNMLSATFFFLCIYRI